MRDMLGNYACPLLVLEFVLFTAAAHDVYSMDEALPPHSKIYHLQAINIQFLNWVRVYLEHYTKTPSSAFQ